MPFGFAVWTDQSTLFYCWFRSGFAFSSIVLEYAVPQQISERQLEGWVRGVLDSKDELAAALERLRDSCCARREEAC
jgi:hypothetical protein